MVARLNEEASQSYEAGSAEITYADLKERIIASTEEQTFTSGDQSITIVNGPSVTRLDDNHGSEPPAILEDETALDYLTRLEEMVASADGHQDFLIIATTGGEFGIAYTRVQADEANSISEEGNLSLSLFPNPANDQLIINGLPAGSHNGQVLDAAGKMVMEVSLTSNEPVDVSGLASGFYTVKVLVNDTFKVEKFQVKR